MMAKRDQEKSPTPPAAAEQSAQPTLLDEIVGEMKVKPADEGYDEARKGVQSLVSQLLRSRRTGERIDRNLVDAMIAEIDRRITHQVNRVIHHPEFQQRESAWRGLRYLVDHCDFRENTRVSLISSKKSELREDFEDAAEIPTSGLYRHVHTAEYGQFGGKPYGAIIANYEFGPNTPDLNLLRSCAAVSAMAHAPFIAGAAPMFFGPGEEDFSSLPRMKDLEAHFEGPQYTKWRGFREIEDARYVGLVLPRFMLRAPYKAEDGVVRTFNFEEEGGVTHDNYLWGNAAFALAARMADSFAKYRWCPNIIGPRAGGTVEDLPAPTYEAMGEVRVKIPTEVLLSERREFELSEQGLIALTMRKDSDNACFFSANSTQKPKFFGTSEEGRAAELNYRLGTQLPYLMMACRVAHYIKVLQREHIGSWTSAGKLSAELTQWIKQYVVADAFASPEMISRHPFREAAIHVEDVPGNAGWYKVGVQLSPHFKYMGANFTLSLVGKLEK
jgi:type VI secretion system protein ImpC